MDKLTFYFVLLAALFAILVFLFFILIKLFGDIAKDLLNEPWVKGKIGELKVKNVLKRTKSENKRIINQIIIKNKQEKTFQIDHILINEYGIFVIETKNYSGTISGSAKYRDWRQYFGKKYKTFPNPLNQNYGHIQELKKILGEDYPYFSVVVFVQNNSKNVKEPHVVNIANLESYLDSFTTKTLSLTQIDIAYKIISSLKNNKLKKEHITKIKEAKKNIENNICPRCESPIVKKEGPYGPFYACEDYPNCRYVKGNYIEDKSQTIETPIFSDEQITETPPSEEPTQINESEPKKIHCNICGCHDLTKIGEYIVCDQCGCKFTIEEAKTMYVQNEHLESTSNEQTNEKQPIQAETKTQPKQLNKSILFMSGIILFAVICILLLWILYY